MTSSSRKRKMCFWGLPCDEHFQSLLFTKKAFINRWKPRAIPKRKLVLVIRRGPFYNFCWFTLLVIRSSLQPVPFIIIAFILVCWLLRFSGIFFPCSGYVLDRADPCHLLLLKRVWSFPRTFWSTSADIDCSVIFVVPCGLSWVITLATTIFSITCISVWSVCILPE